MYMKPGKTRLRCEIQMASRVTKQAFLAFEDSVSHLAELPAIHRDPFDRMLICQAMEHGLTIVTVDNAIRAYPVPVL